MRDAPPDRTLSLVRRAGAAPTDEGDLASGDLYQTLAAQLGDRYALVGELGRGGMATVYRATDLRHPRSVAIKVLLPELARAVTAERFLREIGILARLSHPHILPLIDSGTVEVVPGLSLPWYAMPFVADDTLRARLTREGPLPLDDALRLTSELCSALSQAHAEGIVHRDIKPENVLLPSGQALLADFGIARAVTVAGGMSLSSTGLVVGTPIYMSPEQSAGSERVDARSDIYSLGCVLYEMLAGQPPFTGATPQAISARHQFEPLPPLGVVRPTIPAGVEAVVTRALAKVPADRFASAADFARAIAEAPREERAATTRSIAAAATAPAIGKRARWLVTAGVLVGLGIAGVVAARPAGLFGPPIDPNRVVVLPFAVRGAGIDSLLNGENVGKLVYDALDGFGDFDRVDNMVVADAIARSGAPTSLAESRALAKRLGAGRFIWGEVTRTGDSTRVRGLLFDTKSISPDPVARHSTGLPGDLRAASVSGVVDEVTKLALALVVSDVDSTPLPPRPGTASLAALRAFMRAETAWRQWNLDSARNGFREAIRLDPDFPRANLRLAQIGQWLRDSVTSWRPNLNIALQSRDGLGESERFAATGLKFLSDSAYPEACTVYRRMIAADSSDFVGWFGLGECNLWDQAIEADAGNPTILHFRGSFPTAQRAYLRALAVVPLAHRAAREVLIPRLFQVLPTSTWLRGGHLGNAYFYSWVGWSGDSLTFNPIPSGEFASGTATKQSNTATAAFARSKQLLNSIVDEWVRLFPSSAPAWGARGAILERLHVLRGDSGAVAAVEHAIELTTDSADRARLTIDQVRLALKTGDFALAGRASRALLDTWHPSSAADALRLAPVAALMGRTGQLVDLLRQGALAWEFAAPDGTPVYPPQALAAEALKLYAFAVMGSSKDSVKQQETVVLRMIDGWAPAGRRPAAVLALTENAAYFAFPITGTLEAHRTPGHNSSLDPQIALAQGRRADALARLKSWVTAADTSAGGFLGPEDSYETAALLLATGDTARSEQVLRRALQSLEFQSHLTMLPQATALLRRILGWLGRTDPKWASAYESLQ